MGVGDAFGISVGSLFFSFSFCFIFFIVGMSVGGAAAPLFLMSLYSLRNATQESMNRIAFGEVARGGGESCHVASLLF